jgi:tripartite-type tricarboxylate transporter receptor subunit TctC
MMYDNISTPLAQYKAGKVKALAVTSPERHPACPELPTMAEFYPGFNITSWGGLCGPAGLPPAMVEKAAALTMKALASESVKKAFIQQAATTNWMGPEDLAAFRRKQEQDLAPIIKASGARVD